MLAVLPAEIISYLSIPSINPRSIPLSHLTPIIGSGLLKDLHISFAV
jgi:hypothetical protein